MLDYPQTATVEPTVSVRILRSLVAFAERLGVAPARLLDGMGVEAAALDAHDGRVRHATLAAVYERAVELTDDPALGLHWSERGTSGLTFAPVSPLFAHAPTLREALEVLQRYGRLLSDQAGFELVQLGDRCALRCLRLHPAPRVHRFSCELIMLGFYRVIRGLAPHAPEPQVRFDYPAPPHRAEYARLFHGSEQFDQLHTELVFAQAVLDLRSPHRDDDVHEALRLVADRRIVRLTGRAPYAVRVRERLLREGAHRTDMKECARHLGISVRSLRRRLVDEGTSFNEVALEALALTAKRHLRDQGLSIQETAQEMGFSDTSTFHRAFKRWTGMTPSAYRDADLKAP